MDSLMQFLRNLGTARLIMMGVAGVATFAFFAFVFGRLQSAPMAVLFSDLEAAQAADLVARLESEQVPYETAAGGRVIRVPEDQVDRLRLTLAGEGLTGGVVGKEIFDQDGSFGRTSFELNVNYARAIEGELSRTISQINTVRDARVHIVMPERRPFQRELSQPTASIQLRTQGGGIGNSQVQAIQSLVASAVPGLNIDNVTITDTSGRLLSNGNKGGANAALTFIEENRLAKEDLFRRKIESLLSSSVGAENVRAEVAVEMETSRVNRRETRFDPDGQVAVSTEVSESSSQQLDPSNQVTVANALPGAEANGGNSVTEAENNSREVTNFENSRIETVTVTEPGTITKLRVSVLVNNIPTYADDGTISGYTPRSEQELDNIRSLVLSAIPYNEARDGADAVTVLNMQFADPPKLSEEFTPFNFFGLSKDDLIDLVRNVGLVLTAVLVLLLVVRPIVSRIVEAIPDAASAAEQAALLEQQNAGAPQLAGPDSGITPELIAAAAEGDQHARFMLAQAQASGTLPAGLTTDARIDVARVEGRVQESAIKKVAEIIRSNPTDSVAIVRSWMYAE